MNDESELQSVPGGEAPGAALGRLRVARELSVADVAERIKFSPRQIEALEADDYDKLPGTTFVRGMIRGYAKLLQIDPAPMLRKFEERHAPEHVTLTMHSESIPFPDGNRRATRLYLALSVLAVVAATAILYEWQFGLGAFSPIRSTPPAPAQQVSAPLPPAPPEQTAGSPERVAPVQPAAPVAEAGGAKLILLEFQKESWVEIKDRGGNTLMSKLNPGGSKAMVQGKPPFSVIIGNASGVRLTYGDAAVDLAPYVKVEVARLTLQ